MKKLLLLFLLFSISFNLRSQDKIDYYFDDDGLSGISNHISIDFVELLDATISIEYNHYSSEMVSIILGGAYSFNNGIQHDVALFHSMFYILFLHQSSGFYPSSAMMPSPQGIELWTGLSFNKRYTRKYGVDLHFGLMKYGFIEHSFESLFIDINPGVRIIDVDRAFIRLEFQSRFHIYSYFDNQEIFGDFVFGFGAKIGFKY